MGVDIYSKKGIVASISDTIANIVTESNMANVIKICQDFYDELEGSTQEHFASLNNIQVETDCELRYLLESLIKVQDSGISIYIDYQEDLTELWSRIIDSLKLNLPTLNGVYVWDSPRYCGYEVPIQEPCFVFDDEACFIQKLNAKGKRLQNFLGHCNVSEWTVYSC